MQLTVFPEGGLCNRMRVVASALNFVRSHAGVHCRVLWRRNSDCGAWFDELFEPIDEPRFAVVRARLSQTPAWARWGLLCGRRVAFNFNRSGTDSLAALCASSPRFYVASCYQLCSYASLPMRQVFRPLPFLNERIEALCARFARPVAGLHVRRGDHSASMAHSPTAAFSSLLELIHKEGRFKTVYLATDDARLRQSFVQRYGSFIATQPYDLSARGTIKGMYQAVIDLFVLAHADHVFGSWGSSFSDTAAELFGRPLTIVGE